MAAALALDPRLSTAAIHGLVVRIAVLVDDLAAAIRADGERAEFAARQLN